MTHESVIGRVADGAGERSGVLVAVMVVRRQAEGSVNSSSQQSCCSRFPLCNVSAI